MLQMSVALGRDLGSFWSMSSICVQVRDGRREGGKRMMKEERGRGTGGKKRKEERGTRRVREQDGGREKRGREGAGSGKKMAQILKHVRALSTYQLLQFVTVVPLHWLKGNLR